MLASLAIALLQGGKRAVYLPDCRQLARYPSEYLKDALALTYAGDLEAQSEFLQCATGQALVCGALIERRRWGKHCTSSSTT